MRLLSRRALPLWGAMLLVGACALRAEAQNSKLAPKFGATKLAAGFAPDPRSVSLTAGGPISTKLGGVNAFVADAPSFKLTYTAKAGHPLSIYAKANGDTTILVKLPNGKYLADNDSGNSKSPHVRLTAPASGEYDVWVGTTGKANAAASLWFSETAPKPAEIVVDPKKKPDPVPVVQETITVDNSTVRISQNTLNFRFKIDPPTAKVTASWHWSIAINTPSGASALAGSIFQTQVDTLQQVNIPAGAKGPLVIVVQRDNPASTSQSDPISVPATAPDPTLAPTAGSVRLQAGFMPNPFTKGLTATSKLQTRLGGWPVNVAIEPTYKLNFTAGKFPLVIKANSASDTMLLVQLPDGTFAADDDSGGDRNPLLRFATPQSGQYTIWVGTYKLGEDAAATLSIVEEVVVPPPPPPPPVPDVSVSFNNQSGYVAKFTVTWNAPNNGGAQSWGPSTLSLDRRDTVTIPGGSTNIRIRAEGAAFFGVWRDFYNDAAAPGSYTARGTTFNMSLSKD